MMTVVVAMMLIHHRGRPDGHGPFPFRPAPETWKAWQWMIWEVPPSWLVKKAER